MPGTRRDDFPTLSSRKEKKKEKKRKEKKRKKEKKERRKENKKMHFFPLLILFLRVFNTPRTKL